jgi:thymidylate synthase (FAD)
VSRALTHQLVRHRIASYSQQSQRYVTMKNFPYVTPPGLLLQKQRAELLGRYQAMMNNLGQLYEEMLQAGVAAEDARYILPNACETKIVVTMNARELLHFFRLRCCNRAQWEIHGLADEVLRLAKEKAPTIFEHAGPGCLAGGCPEGKMSCGLTTEVREKYEHA